MSEIKTNQFKFSLGDKIRTLVEKIEVHNILGKQICAKDTIGYVCHADDDHVLIEAKNQDGEIKVFAYHNDEVKLIEKRSHTPKNLFFRVGDEVEILVDSVEETNDGPSSVKKGTIAYVVDDDMEDHVLVNTTDEQGRDAVFGFYNNELKLIKKSDY